MTPESLQQLLTTAGIVCRVKKDEVVLETCVFCGNDHWNLDLSAEKGVYSCWVCKVGGRLDRLLATLTGEHHHVPVSLDKTRAAAGSTRPVEGFLTLPIEMVYPAARYLERRGVDVETIREFGLAVCAEPGHLLEGRIVIPARDFWTGAVVGWVGRTYSGVRPKYLSTLPRAVVTGWRMRGKQTPCVVVEGHLDGIAVARGGFSVAVLGGTGVTGAVEEWAARLLPTIPVVVMLDGTAVAEATRLYWAIRAVRGGAPTHFSLLAEEQDPAMLGPTGIQTAVREVLGGGLLSGLSPT